MSYKYQKLAKKGIGYRKGKTAALHGFSILEKLHSCINALIESCCPFPKISLFLEQQKRYEADLSAKEIIKPTKVY
jgi:hypothetical protein